MKELNDHHQYTVDMFEQWMNHKPKEYPVWTFDETGRLIAIEGDEVKSNFNILGEDK